MTNNTNNDSHLHISEIDVSKFIFKLKAPDQKKQELDQTIYVNYEEERGSLTFQTSEIEIYGKKCGYTHPDYVKEESHKASLKLPINKEDSISLIKLNEHLKSPEFKKIFGKSMNKFKLTNIIRIEEDDDSIPNRINVKIKYNGDENKRTRIYQGLNEENEIPYNSIDDFQKIVKYGGRYVFVIKVSRIWAKKATLPEPDYGITFQVNQVYIIKSNNQTNNKNNKSLNLKYISNEIIEENINVNKKKESKSTSSSSNSKPINKDDSDDSDDTDDSDGSDESNKPVKKTTQPVARQVVESDSESDEPKKPVPVAKPVARRVVDSDAESDEQELKPQKPKPKSKSSKAK